MNDDLKVTKDMILKAANKCHTAKEVLREMFPSVFMDEWKQEYCGIKEWVFDPVRLIQGQEYWVRATNFPVDKAPRIDVFSRVKCNA